MCRLLIFAQALIILFLINGSISSSLWAQGWDDIAEAILQLRQDTIDDSLQIIDGQLYGGEVDATITNHDTDPENFENGDTIDFRITAVRGKGRLTLTFEGTRKDFDVFVERNIDLLLEILFPTSLAEGLTGKDTAQNHSQQFLLSRVLERKLRRIQLGGFVAYEWFNIDDTDGNALQGLIYMDRFASALEWRYAELDDEVGTRSLVVGLDVYPHYTIRSVPVEWSVGGDIFATFLYSKSDVFDRGIGALDYGAGIWSSALKDFERMRIATGAVFQASNIHIPSAIIHEDLEFVAEAINDRAIDWNLTYGMILGILLMDPLSLNLKLLENHSFTLTGGHDVTSQTILLVTLSHLVGGVAPIDIGYKRTMGLEGMTSNAVVLQGNFRW